MEPVHEPNPCSIHTCPAAGGYTKAPFRLQLPVAVKRVERDLTFISRAHCNHLQSPSKSLLNGSNFGVNPLPLLSAHAHFHSSRLCVFEYYSHTYVLKCHHWLLRQSRDQRPILGIISVALAGKALPLLSLCIVS